ncbi:MAG: c-type cytochrome, partial [Pirellulaceae bacterium]
AIWTLDGLGAMPVKTLEAALTDSHAGVRRNAVRIAARVVVDANRLARLVDDPDAKVRLELASTLGAYDGPTASAALARLVIGATGDRYMLAAAMSSLNPRNVSAVLAAVIQSADRGSEPVTLELIGQAVAMGDSETIARVIETVCKARSEHTTKKQFESLARILDGLASRKWPTDQLHKTAVDRIAETIQQARTAAANQATAEDVRAASTLLLGREAARRKDDFKLLERLLVPLSPAVLQRAVVAHLARRSEPSVAEVVLAGWRSHSPALRSQILDLLASRGPWAEALRHRLEDGTILASELSAPVRQRLLDRDKNAPQWREALATKASISRAEILRRFQPALKLDGDAKRGVVLFRKSCINCHKVKGEGHEVGPQLVSITNKTKETLLNSILDPSAAVDAKFFSYSIVTSDGRILTGMLETETGSSITLLAAGGKRETVLRRDIEELQASTKSLMPEGLEEGLKPQDVADLLQFVLETFR